MSDRYSVTRRSILVGIASALAPSVGFAQADVATPNATPKSLGQPEPIDLVANSLSLLMLNLEAPR